MSATKVLSINEIRTNIDRFVAEWSEDTNERAEAQTFWNEFLACFGVSRRRVASFEQRATRASTANIGRIDMFWPRVMIAEHKSAGMMRDDSAENQALDYLHGGDISSHEFPRYVISSDFQSFRLKDLDGEDGSATITFPLNKLRDHVEDFIWLAGYEAREFSTKEQEVASVKAAKYMAQLYVAMVGDKDEGLVENKSDEDEDSLAASILLTRLLFLLFGDDAGLWERGLFEEFLEKRTTEDGSDLGSQLSSLFEILNTPESQRSPRADEIMLQFPYVNGDLFAERQATEFFDREMREALLDASRFDWTAISPAVFGSLFQEIKSKAARREHGEFYTTEANILKTLEPLFLDEIRAQVKSAWKNAKKLREIHASFENMQYFDPACGCGNFLIVAYREMRAIELEILERLRELEGKKGAISIDGEAELNVSLNQFYGIELNWWPAKIAEVAMFLVDHQANREMALRLGLAPNRLPISITPRIHHGNALHTDWSSLLEPTADTLVFGNPPFSGQSTREAEQAADLETVWGAGYNGYLDYVTGWHAKTMQFFERGGGNVMDNGRLLPPIRSLKAMRSQHCSSQSSMPTGKSNSHTVRLHGNPRLAVALPSIA